MYIGRKPNTKLEYICQATERRIMIFNEKTIKLKDGSTCHFRNPKAEDAMLAYLNLRGRNKLSVAHGGIHRNRGTGSEAFGGHKRVAVI